MLKGMRTSRLEAFRSWLSLNRRGWRLFVGVLCTLALALFLHFRETRFELLELNTAAPRYVVAQVDFEFPDYETTIILKQQAMQDVGDIYQIEDVQIRDVRYELEKTLIHDKQWRSAAPMSTFEEMYKASDEMETLLLEARFTDPRTLQKIREIGLSEQSFFEFVPASTDQGQLLPAEFWNKMRQGLESAGSFRKETIDFVVRSFQTRSWMLVKDAALIHSLRMQVGRALPEKMTRVQAGERIIDQGQIVSSRHLAMMQAMKQAISESHKVDDPLSMISSMLLAIIFVTISGLYFRIAQPAFIRSLRQVALFISIVILTLALAKLTEYTLLKSSSSVLENVRYPILAPFATILVCVLLSPRTALFAATFLSIILSVSLAIDHSRFLVLNLVASIVVIIASQGLRKRKEVFTVCMKSWFAAIPVLWAYTLIEGHLWTAALSVDIAASFVFLLSTAVLAVGLLPALETLFGVLTDITLMEFMDPNTPLLRRLAIEVPGTYQHSLVLGNLAEACAQSIGANGLFCRAATLYHDIGKMFNPQFYTENQQGTVSVHQLLTPVESAQVIISHVTDGEILGKKNNLPQEFLDIIREHHGTTLVYYFYRKQLELQGGKAEAVDERIFRYPGPKPSTRESAIIMICDTIEAASRSLDEVTEKTLTQLVNRLVAERADEGQFDDCPLTFEELSKVKKTLVQSLYLAQHVRIKYPKREK